MNQNKIFIKGMVSEGGPEVEAAFNKHLQTLRDLQASAKAESEESEAGLYLACGFFGEEIGEQAAKRAL